MANQMSHYLQGCKRYLLCFIAAPSYQHSIQATSLQVPMWLMTTEYENANMSHEQCLHHAQVLQTLLQAKASMMGTRDMNRQE